MDNCFTSYQVEERSFIAYIKREIHNQVGRGHFSETRTGEIDIIVSEVCSNLVKHVGSGELLYRINHEAETSQFELLSIDRGPGITDVARMMRDGISTTNTLGQGLGAIERLSDTFQIYSIPDWGTVLYSRVSSQKAPLFRKESFEPDIKALCVAKPRETICGDGFRVKKTENDVLVFFGDGLGHGLHASEAAEHAANIFFNSLSSDPVQIIREMHDQGRRTRGLVGTVAVMNKKTNSWSICGVGNILTRLYNGIVYRNYMSYNGTIGLNIPTSMKSSVFPVERNQMLIMTSDGIKTRWDLSKYPSVMKYDSMVLAASVYKDFSRGNDDSSILIAKVG